MTPALWLPLQGRGTVPITTMWVKSSVRSSSTRGKRGKFTLARKAGKAGSRTKQLHLTEEFLCARKPSSLFGIS